MSNDSLTEEVKARVPEELKAAVERIAKERHLKPADIIRKALRDFIAEDTKPTISEGAK